MGAQYIYISNISREYINIYVVDRYGILGDVSSEAVTRRLEQESEALEREKVVSIRIIAFSFNPRCSPALWRPRSTRLLTRG